MKFRDHESVVHSDIIQFQRFGHLQIMDVDSFLALLNHRIGPIDPQSTTQVSTSLTELRWSRRGLVIVYTKADGVNTTTEMLFDCTDCTTWVQLLDVLAIISRLTDNG